MQIVLCLLIAQALLFQMDKSVRECDPCCEVIPVCELQLCHMVEYAIFGHWLEHEMKIFLFLDTIIACSSQAEVQPGHKSFQYYIVYTGCLRKKYGVAYYQYFENGKTQQCDIFRLNQHNLCLVEWEVSTPYVKSN